MSITTKMKALNASDLSKLSQRISDLKKQAESINVKAGQSAGAALQKNTSSLVTKEVIVGGGLTSTQIIKELAQAKRSAA